MAEQVSRSANGMLWVWWVAASTVAVLAAWYFAYASIAVLKRIAGPVNEDQLLMPILVVAMSIGQAILQWLVLRRHLAHAARWIAATIAGWIVASGSLMIAAWSGSYLRDLILRPETVLYIVGILWGLGIGAMQWLVLRRSILRAGWWIPANMIGWLCAMLVVGPTLNNAAEMAALGAVPAVISGMALVWLLRQPPQQPILRQRHAA